MGNIRSESAWRSRRSHGTGVLHQMRGKTSSTENISNGLNLIPNADRYFDACNSDSIAENPPCWNMSFESNGLLFASFRCWRLWISPPKIRQLHFWPRNISTLTCYAWDIPCPCKQEDVVEISVAKSASVKCVDCSFCKQPEEDATHRRRDQAHRNGDEKLLKSWDKNMYELTDDGTAVGQA